MRSLKLVGPVTLRDDLVPEPDTMQEIFVRQANEAKWCMPSTAYTIGEQAEISCTFTDEDVRDYCRITRCDSPLYLDAAHASNTIYRQRIVPKTLVAGLFESLIETQLPGTGALLGETFFVWRNSSPVYPDDTILAQVIVRELDTSCGRMLLQCIASVESRLVNKIVLEGEVKLMLFRK